MPPPKEVNLKKKICLLGDSAVGKTSLIRKYVYDIFDDSYIVTIGTKVTEANISFHRADTKFNLKLMIWDILGQEKFTSVRTSAYLGSSGALLVCDITRRETLDNIKNWAAGFLDVVGDAPMILLANKVDLMERCIVDKDSIKAVASLLGIPYYFTSAKTGKNANEAFFVLGETLIRKAMEKKELEKPKEEGRRDILKVMDQIIDTYCTLHGGQERAMPIIQEQFKVVGLDISNPTIDGLKRLVENLSKITEIYSSPEYAEKEKKVFMKLIAELEK